MTPIIEYTVYPTCPWCGFDDREPWDWVGKYEYSTVEKNCVNCSKPFRCTTHVRYTTEKEEE